MRILLRPATLSALLPILALTGCNKKTSDESNFKTAINDYYANYPECLWKNPVKFPVQANASDKDKTARYDALLDSGLLTRTPVEKKKLLVFTEQANLYDVSAGGRGSWTPDPTQPGFGNFCYGHRKVQNIVSNTAAGTTPGTTSTVNYTYTIGDVAGWAKAAEVQNAYPDLRSVLGSASSASTTLVLTNAGWKVPASRTQVGAGNAGGDAGVVQ